MGKTWNRWHTDGWVLTVVRNADGQFAYSAAQHEQTIADRVPAKNLADAQHRAEDVVRGSSHRCAGPCSYWVTDEKEDL